MPLGLASEIWNELKRHISTVDREEAAETLVNVMIDNGYDSAEIREAFKGDSEIKHILSAYMDDHDEDDEDDLDNEYDFDDEY